MNKKYIDNFYNSTLQNKKYESFGLSLPMTIIHKQMLFETELFLKEKYDLLSSHIDVLASLYFNGHILTPTELYNAMIFSSGGMTKVLKKLENKNYIKRKSEANDKRKILVALTQDGIDLVEEALGHIQLSKDKFFSVLNAKEKKALLDILKKLTYNL